MTASEDGVNYTHTYVYDSDGVLIRKDCDGCDDESGGDGMVDETTTYGYDSAGRLVSAALESPYGDITTTYSYDASGFLVGEEIHELYWDITTYVTYKNDLAGNLLREERDEPQGVAIDWLYEYTYGCW
jgi:YD repeat-containing protein